MTSCTTKLRRICLNLKRTTQNPLFELADINFASLQGIRSTLKLAVCSPARFATALSKMCKAWAIQRCDVFIFCVALLLSSYAYTCNGAYTCVLDCFIMNLRILRANCLLPNPRPDVARYYLFLQLS